MASAVTFAAVAYAIGLRDAPVSNPDLVRVLPEMARMFLPLGPAPPESSSFWPLAS